MDQLKEDQVYRSVNTWTNTRVYSDRFLTVGLDNGQLYAGKQKSNAGKTSLIPLIVPARVYSKPHGILVE